MFVRVRFAVRYEQRSREIAVWQSQLVCKRVRFVTRHICECVQFITNSALVGVLYGNCDSLRL